MNNDAQSNGNKLTTEDPFAFTVRVDDLMGHATRDLLAYHFAQMHDISPTGEAFVFDLDALMSPAVVVWSAWHASEIAAVGALRDLGRGHGELKSMRTHPNWVRKGAASAILDHIIRTASACGMTMLSLETGSGPAFDAAIALYRSRGFSQGDAFGAYRQSNFSRFFHLSLR